MSVPTTAVARYEPVLSDFERMTLLGFLAAYRGYTREAYALDLRQFSAWCWQHHRRLFDVRRVDIECFARDLEDRGRARATVARRLCTIVGFYRYAEEEGVIEHSPAVQIRRPRIDYPRMSPTSTATSSGRSWSPPDSHRPVTMRWCHCWR
jgi:integrase/recombinase XerD